MFVDEQTPGAREAGRELDRALVLWPLLPFWLVPVFAVAVVVVGLAVRLLAEPAGVWELPALCPTAGWIVFSLARRELWLPVWVAGLHGRARGVTGVVLAFAVRECWGVWAVPAQHAWDAAYGGLSSAYGVQIPFGAVIAASPVALGFVSLLLLVFAMVVAPRGRDSAFSPPPASEPLRSPLRQADAESEWELRR